MPLPGRAPVLLNVPATPPGSAWAPTPLPVAAAPRPVVRAVPPDEPTPLPPPPEPLRVPPPDQLNVTAAKTMSNTVLDWNTAHVRLDHLGATAFHIDRLADGACCASCLVPSPQPGQGRHFEARAHSADEAVRLVLDEAEKWARAK